MISSSNVVRRLLTLFLTTAIALLVIRSLDGDARAQSPSQGSQSSSGPIVDAAFQKFGKFYVNMNRISHVIDEPGANMPPGSLQIYFAGSQNWVALYDTDAQAFREALQVYTVGSTESTTGQKPTGQASGKGTTLLLPDGTVPSTKGTVKKVGTVVPKGPGGATKKASPGSSGIIALPD